MDPPAASIRERFRPPGEEVSRTICLRKTAELEFDSVPVIPTTSFESLSEEALVEYCEQAAGSAPERPVLTFSIVPVNRHGSRDLPFRDAPSGRPIRAKFRFLYRFFLLGKLLFPVFRRGGRSVDLQFDNGTAAAGDSGLGIDAEIADRFNGEFQKIRPLTVRPELPLFHVHGNRLPGGTVDGVEKFDIPGGTGSPCDHDPVHLLRGAEINLKRLRIVEAGAPARVPVSDVHFQRSLPPLSSQAQDCPPQPTSRPLTEAERTAALPVHDLKSTFFFSSSLVL